MHYQPPLPPEYADLPPAQAIDRILARKRELGRRLVILGHHYQRDEVIGLADFTGDSLKLCRQAAAADADFIVFCGVHFMAESADILTGGRRVVVLPDLSAGCAMAEMAEPDDLADALAFLSAGGAKVVPVTYVNSTAAAKAVTARWGGACCTSGNARRVFEWALAPRDRGGAGGQKVLALPDQHLGRNTAVAMGFSPDECLVYDPRQERGGLTAEAVERARFILWKGHCYVHQRFTVEQIERVRRQWPGVRVIVHPECPLEVVRAADEAGSTEQIIQRVQASPPGARWAVGTEANLVRRLAAACPDRPVRTLADTPPMCITMARIDPPHVLWVLDNLAQGQVVNRVSVPPDVAAEARAALERMIAM